VEQILERLAIFCFISIVVAGLFYENHSYNNVLRDYYFCAPYESSLDATLPILNEHEFNNFEKNYDNFSTKYYCEIKKYTRKQFNVLRLKK